jgi:murein DD-endopeptidase MepM/ murein hydrolase activator NlpD
MVVVVRHGYGFETRYGHCEQILVETGSQVKRGQTIALVGNSGRSTGPHLHYEVIRDGVAVDPGQYIIDYEEGKQE